MLGLSRYALALAQALLEFTEGQPLQTKKMSIKLKPRAWRSMVLLCLCPIIHTELLSQTTNAENTRAKSSAAGTNSKSEPKKEDEVNSSPRERGRILQKRNPIASEYQIFGELGTIPGSELDGEGVDFRAFFPTSSLFSGPSESLSFEYNLNYNNLSGNAESGGGFAFKRVLGTEKNWAFSAKVGSTASDRQIEHFEAVWQEFDQLEIEPDSPLSQTGDAPLYYLDRPRYTVDEIYTRNNVYSAQIAHQLTENHTIFFNTYYQDYSDHFYRNRLELQYGAGTLVNEDAESIREPILESAQFENARTRRYFGDTTSGRARQHNILGGKYQGNQWDISYSLYTHRWDIDRYWYNWNFNDFGLNLSYDISDESLPTYEVEGLPDLTDQSNARFSSLRIHDSITQDEDFAWRIDAERKGLFFDTEVWFQAGLLHREKERISEEDRAVYSVDSQNPFFLSDVERDYSPGLIIDGQILQQNGLDAQAGANLLTTNPDKFQLSEYRSKVESAPNFYDAFESVSSAYFLAASTIGDWTLEAGARIEDTKTRTNGTIVIPEIVDDPDEGVLIERVLNPISGNYDVIKEVRANSQYSNFLPSFEATYTISNNTKLKAAWYQTIMRPQYFDIVEYRRVSIPTRSISEGNSSLNPTTIDKFRLALLQDLNQLGSLSIEAYAVDVKDFFYGAVSNELIQEDGEPEEYTVGRVENGENAEIRGFEAQWLKKFGQSQLWDRSDISLAYTYSDSEATVSTRPNEILDVPERSRHLLKFGLSAQKGFYSGRLSFNYQSAALDDIGDRSAEDEYREKVVSLSLSNTFELSEKSQVYLNLFSLTDQPERSYEGSPLKKLRNQYSDRYAIFGFRQSF